MRISKTKELQAQKLQELCESKAVEFKSMEILLKSVKTKKLLKRNNYHQETINDIIQKAIK